MAVRVMVLVTMAIHAAEAMKMHRGAALPALRSLPLHWPPPRSTALSRTACMVAGAAATTGEDDSSSLIGEWAKQESLVVTKGPHVKVAGKTLNPCGLFICILTMSVCACCYPPLLLSYALSRVFDNKKRRMVDYIVNIWAKMVSRIYITLEDSLPPRTPHTRSTITTPYHLRYLAIPLLSQTSPLPLISEYAPVHLPTEGAATYGVTR